MSLARMLVNEKCNKKYNCGMWKICKSQSDWPLGVLIKKCKIRSKGVVKGSRDLLFEILGPPPYLGNG